MNITKIVAVIFSIIPALGVAQQSPAPVVVDSLQPPAWVERGDIRIALMPGMELVQTDKIGTGELGKLLLRLGEGSDVKLGENVAMKVDRLEPASSAPDSVFSSILNVLKGAFRFTTTLLGENVRRDIRIKLGTATIGLRGTDVWGKSTPAEDFVVLLEGKIEIRRMQDAALTMDQPLTVYNAPRGGPADMVLPVDMDRLQIWARETELDKGKAVISAKGPYRIYLSSYRNPRWASSAQQDLQKKGYAVEQFPVEIEGVNWIRLGIKGFISYADANYFRLSVPARLNITGAWLSRS